MSSYTNQFTENQELILKNDRGESQVTFLGYHDAAWGRLAIVRLSNGQTCKVSPALLRKSLIAQHREHMAEFKRNYREGIDL